MSKEILCFLIYLLICFSSHAQNFTNPDLEGTISGYSSLPDNWQVVPSSDINCIATSGGTTPDLVDETEPGADIGAAGIAYSGDTFVGGSVGVSSSSGTVFQEGIKQTVTDLTIGQSYSISFYQSVVKVSQSVDTSGSWMVIKDNEILGVSEISVSYLAQNDINLIWEYRSVSFEATETSHEIKFLPFDDDDETLSDPVSESGALYMGIDLIELQITALPIEKELDDYLVLCMEDQFPIALANSLTISGGIEPYTFYWNCDYEPFEGSGIYFDENDFLDDPTASNPNLIYSISGDTIVFELSITDNVGTVCLDTISVITSCWNTILTGCDLVTIELGESVNLCSPHSACLEPSTYLWPTLFPNGDYMSATPLVSPVFDTEYCVEIQDAVGCFIGSCMTVLVEYDSVTEQDPTGINLYPNPSNDYIILESLYPIEGIEIYNSLGKLVYSSDVISKRTNISLEDFSTGVYVLKSFSNSSVLSTDQFIITK